MAAPTIDPPVEPGTATSFSPVENEPPLRWQRALHLAPKGGLGVGRRAVIFALATWVPIAVWALLRGRFVEAAAGEPLLHHYGVHVRCLVVIPLLILGEASLHKAALRYLPQFIRSGLVDGTSKPRFEAALRAMRRWRDRSLPWVLVVGIALGWAIVDRPEAGAAALSWALDESGGLGFVETLPGAFAPVTFALSAMLASRWAHEIVHHGQTLNALKLPAAMFVVIWSLLLLAPLFALMPVLRAAKRAALPSYAALVATQGRHVRRKWIDGAADAESPLLEPTGVGPIADAATMYDAVRSMRSLPLGKASLAGIIVPIVVPMLVVAALQIPLKTLLLKLVKALL